MVRHPHMTILRTARRFIFVPLALVLCPPLLANPVRTPPPARSVPTIEPRADLLDVEKTAVRPPASMSIPGAAVRAFRDEDDSAPEVERYTLRWFVHPPGIPSAGVVLFEYVQERNPLVKNRVLRIPDRSNGHAQDQIEIPSEDIRRDGSVQRWRATIAWRGNVLSRRTSGNWQ